jgi:hypothetical protein
MTNLKKKILIAAAVVLLITAAVIVAVQALREERADGLAPYDFSMGRDIHGYWADVAAVHYVVMFDYRGIEIPYDVHDITDGMINNEIILLFREILPFGEDITDRFVAEHFEEKHGWTTVEGMTQNIHDFLLQQALHEFITEYFKENVTITMLPEQLMRVIERGTINWYQEEDDVAGLLERYRETNTEMARFQLIMQAIAEDMQLRVTEEDIRAHYGESFEETVQTHGIPNMAQQTMFAKVFEEIFAHAVYLEGE